MRKPAEVWLSMLLTAALSNAAPTVTPGDPAPTPELLEFLGSFETRDGAWVDPQQFDPRPTVPTETRMPDDPAGNDHGKN